MRHFRLITLLPTISAVITLGISALVLYGWHIGSRWLIAWSHDVATMKVNVAIAAILAAISLLTLRRESVLGILSAVCAAASACVGLVTLAEYALGAAQTGFDEAFVRDLDPGQGLVPGRMAPASALSFVLIGAALFLARRNTRHRMAQFVSFPAAVIVILSLAGYFYGSTELSRFAPFGAMALNTTLTCVVLLAGLYCAIPDTGVVSALTRSGLSGSLARRLIPFAVVAPAVVGWLRLRGQRLGLYGTEFGIAILTVTTILVLVLFILGVVRFLAGMEAAREQADLDLKNQRDALKQQTELIDLSNDAIIIADSQRRIVSWNAGAEALYGWPAIEARGQVIHDLLKTSTPVGVHQIDEILGQTLQWEGELVQTCRDGRQVTVDSRHILQPARDGVPGRYLEINRDITDRKRLEEQLFQSQKLESLGQLAGGVAHDFNNLLTVINGYCELLGASGMEQRYLDDVAQIRSAGEQAVKLTQQLLAFSRKQLLKSEVLNLNHVIADTTRMLRRLIGAPIELIVDLAPDLGNIRGDPAQIQQIIMNLAVNGRDAMSGGGTLRIETANISMSSRHKDGGSPARFARMTITDNGAGMTSEVRERIFEPFFTTKSRERGTGLGLSTVYGIVQQMGGQIQVESEVGRGTTFHVCFPLTDDTFVQPAPAVQGITKGTESILVVEDEKNVRALIVTALEGMGYTVWKAADGEEALAFCESHKGDLDLLVTDVVMPGMDGHELVRRVRQMRPSLPILMISGYTSRTTPPNAGPEVAYLPKPLTPASLGNKVRQLLSAAAVRKTILLVEDDAPVRRAMKRFLVNAGYAVLDAENGRQALEILAQPEKVDLVVTDMVMDVQGGEEMIGKLKERYPSLRIIAMSGAFRNDSGETAAGLGVHATIRKPFAWPNLLETVRRVMP